MSKPRSLRHRRLFAEALGTAIFVATVVGSGIMAERLAGGNEAIALLGNTIPTGAILIVIITILGPVSGAHFNPRLLWCLPAGVVPVERGHSLRRGSMPWWYLRDSNSALDVRSCAAAIGTTGRSGPSQWLAEAVATFTLVLAILGGIRYAPSAIPWLVGLTITAAYWFTASTSFANPAVTLARGFTTTFAGIAINHVPAFVVAQLIGAAIGAGLSTALFAARAHSDEDEVRATTARESASPR